MFRPLTYRFPRYATREEYTMLTGLTPKAFDPSKPPKHWQDRSVSDEPERLYDVVRFDARQQPYAGKLILTPEEAVEVNIPPSNLPPASQPRGEVPQPIVPLAAYERLGWHGIPALRVVVFDTRVQPSKAISFTEEHERMLQETHAAVTKKG